MKPVKPTKETLSRAYILQTALDLLDQISLQKFTMRKLGQKMKVSPMAVYRYFPNQGALFDGVVELIWKKALVFNPSKVNDSWQVQVIALMSQLRQTLLKHPHILPLISTHPIVTKSEFMLVEEILTKLKTKGMNVRPTTVFLINSLTVYTLGFVWAEAIEPKDGGKTDPKVMKELQDNSDLLSGLLQVLQTEQYTADQQFLMGLKAILNGWK
ncbi:TetR/AcrR family transcriptional regulator [Liquorilactobacillus uvarum]|uniref:TetR/AcrR family transcriptional regulator n=2 Tax=Liquorilactobacillus uvarum TaxID=303240 RepID=UPI00288988B3|nr:TetR/AcrR family transcriptional regulator C-terminal domain-containing protein [Liquorilactobacillus uvarum]